MVVSSFDTHNEFRFAVTALPGGNLLSPNTYRNRNKNVSPESKPSTTIEQGFAIRIGQVVHSERARPKESPQMARSIQRGDKVRKPIPFIFGAFAHKDEILARAQEFFLWVVHSTTPAPLYALRDGILPGYVAAFQFERHNGRSDTNVKERAWWALADALIAEEHNEIRQQPEFQAEWSVSRQLYEATEDLLRWSTQFNLRGIRFDNREPENPESMKSALQRAMWPVIAALETILDWHFGLAPWLRLAPNPPLWRAPIRLLKGFPNQPEVLPPITLRGPVCKFPPSAPSDSEGVEQAGWYIGLESEQQFRARVRSCFEVWLNRYTDGKKDAAGAAGFEEVPPDRELDHFYWTAKFQVERMTSAEIAKAAGRTKSAVEKGIDGVLKLINLEKRPVERGRTTHKRSNSK
jgi:hypothetical protein